MHRFAKYTRRWRYACRKLFSWIDDPDNAAHGSLSPGRDGPFKNPPAYSSKYDRNWLLYFAMHYKNSYDHESLDPLSFDPLTFAFEYCSETCAYRTPMDAATAFQYQTYEEEASRGGAVHCYDIAPIVGYGSLDALRGELGGALTDTAHCGDSLEPQSEDFMQETMCGRVTEMPDGATFFHGDNELRKQYSPFQHQRTMCNPSEYWSVQDAVGNARLQLASLYDSNSPRRYTINNLVAPKESRGDSLFDERFMKRSLVKFVYVTSSSDPSVAPGLHRLMDLQVFRELSCRQMPFQQCSYTVLAPMFSVGNLEIVNSAPFYTGRRAVLRARCNQELQNSLLGEGACPVDCSQPRHELCCECHPYKDLPTCFQDSLPFIDAPQQYPSRTFWHRFGTPPPTPPPAPSLPPPAPPLPPSPIAPPPRALDFSVGQVKEHVREYENAFCASVYYLSSQTRCTQLAVDLQTRFYSSYFVPPSPSPAVPDTPRAPPAPMPPLPELEPSFHVHPVHRVSISTLLSPTPSVGYGASQVNTVLVGWDAARSLQALNDNAYDAVMQRAGCTTAQQDDLGAQLPCASAFTPDYCIDGARPCSDDPDRNAAIREISREPELVMELDDPPNTRFRFPFALRIVLPPDNERSKLLYESQFSDGGRGYVIEFYDAHGRWVNAFVRQTNSQLFGFHQDGLFVLHHYLAVADQDDEYYYSLSTVKYIKLRLYGDYRQIYVQRIDLIEHDLDDISHPPPPPGPPATPLAPPPPYTPGENATQELQRRIRDEQPPPLPPPSPPPPPPSLNFTWYPSGFFQQDTFRVVHTDVCGLTQQQCADNARDLRMFFPGIDSFTLSQTGCCRMLDHNSVPLTQVVQAPQVGLLGTGVIFW